MRTSFTLPTGSSLPLATTTSSVRATASQPMPSAVVPIRVQVTVFIQRRLCCSTFSWSEIVVMRLSRAERACFTSFPAGLDCS